MKNSKPTFWVKRLVKHIFILAVAIIICDAVFVLGFPKKQLPKAGERVDAVVVLGAAPNSPAIRNRAELGRRLYEQGLAKAIILTGGVTSSKDESEAKNMARFLSKNTSTTLPLVLEEHSVNTFENLENSKGLVPGVSTIIIVSDSYHLPRAFLIAKRLGYKDVYWASPDSGYYRPSELAWYYAREMVAIVAYLPRLLGF